DVAYKLSPSLGVVAVAIKVDGKICPLNTVIPNVATIEVIKDLSKTEPDKEWLTYANLETRRIIEKQLMVSERDKMIAKGKEMFVNEVLIERGILELKDLDEVVVSSLLSNLNCWHGTNDLYYKVADGMDLERVREVLDALGVKIGGYTSVQIEGDNAPGV
ncbi:MAG: hypothetical protein ACKPFF_07990, partial [Planktothrix sp.]